MQGEQLEAYQEWTKEFKFLAGDSDMSDKWRINREYDVCYVPAVRARAKAGKGKVTLTSIQKYEQFRYTEEWLELMQYSEIAAPQLQETVQSVPQLPKKNKSIPPPPPDNWTGRPYTLADRAAGRLNNSSDAATSARRLACPAGLETDASMHFGIWFAFFALLTLLVVFLYRRFTKATKQKHLLPIWDDEAGEIHISKQT